MSGPRRRLSPTFEPLEPRTPADAAALATVAAGLYNSPLAVAARAAQLAYQAGQLAWTGQTSFLLGSVRVTQPYPLKAVRDHHPSTHAHAPTPAPALPTIAFRAPTFPKLPLHKPPR